MPLRYTTRRNPAHTLVAALVCLAAAGPAGAAPKTVCTVTINSSDEREVFQRHLPRDEYRFVELVQSGRRDWLASACQRGVSCDALIVSGHYDDGTEFYTDRLDRREFLTVHELQQASCSASCKGLFAQLKEVYLFGCNTLKQTPRLVAAAEIERSLARSGRAPADALRIASLLSERYGQSNRDQLRDVFKGVPVIYGFSSKAPLGRTAGPLLERYFQAAPAGEVASGRSSPTLLKLFGASSMVAVPGLSDAEPQAGLRHDMCGLVDDGPSHARKLAFMHEVLQRDVTEVRMFLDHLERYAGSLGPAQRQQPGVAAALLAIEQDAAARERFLVFARDADQATVQLRMLALARTLGWLSAAQEQAELLRVIARRMARDALGRYEVDLFCAAPQLQQAGLAARLLATGSVRPAHAAHAAVLACLGSAEAHERTVRALTGGDDEAAAIAQVYLRHRPPAGDAELRDLTSKIAHMTASGAQLRALQTLAKLPVTDVQTVQEVARLFPLARSLEVQRAIAGILIRSDTRGLARADLVRTLRQHRLRSADGRDVIDLLIQILQAA